MRRPPKLPPFLLLALAGCARPDVPPSPAAAASALGEVTCDGSQPSCPLPIEAFVPYADSDSAWIADVDIRGMLRLFHPATISKAKRAAGARMKVAVPEGWRRPTLRLYTTDNYHAADSGPVQNFVGHRFRQVVINEGLPSETLGFQVDVSEPDHMTHPLPIDVDLSAFAGTSVTLTLRVYDEHATTTPLPGDRSFHPENPDGTPSGATEPPRFWLLAFFADAVLLDAAADPGYALGLRPHDQEFVPKTPLHPRGEGPAVGKIELAVRSPAGLPAGYPITVSVPFPPGAVVEAEPLPVRVLDAANRSWPLQARPIGWWPDPDGSWSVRFALLTLFPPDGAQIEDGTPLWLAYNQGTGPAPPQVSVAENVGNQRIENGPVIVDSGTDPEQLLAKVRIWDGAQYRPLLTGLRLSSQCPTAQGSGIDAEVASRRTKVGPYADDGLVTQGAPEVVLESEGTLALAGQRVGRFTHRVYVRARSTTLRTELLTTWEASKPAIARLTLCASTPQMDAAAAGMREPSGVIIAPTGALTVSQTKRDHFAALGGTPMEGERLSGWIAVSGPSGEVQASTWRFSEQAPQSLAATGNALVLHLFDGAVAASPELDTVYAPNIGESKRHDVTFSFSPVPIGNVERTVRGALADRPPYLFDRRWWSRTGAIALLDERWGEKQPQLTQEVRQTYGDARPETMFPGGIVGWGLRGFGDHAVHFTDPDAGNQSKQVWSNGYWENVQGTLHWALGYGDLEWLQRSIDHGRHIGEVGSLRLLPLPDGRPDPDQGAITALQPDHAARVAWSRNEGDFAWSAFQVGQSLVLNHWMTGDPESRSAALNNADALIRRQLPGITHAVSMEPRNAARPMLTLLRAWEMTKNDAYRAAAQSYLDNFGPQADADCDYRRGSHILDVTNYSGVTAGLSAMYAMNAYDYYRETGYQPAARMVIGIADAVYAEAMPAYPTRPETLGDIVFYARYARTEHYFPQAAILFYEAYDLTGDPRFLRAARATADRYTKFCADPQLGHGCQRWHDFGWLDPYLGGWMRELPAPDSGVTQATERPDPVNLCACSPHATCNGQFDSDRCGPCAAGYIGDGLSCSTNLSVKGGAFASSSSALTNSEAWRAIDGNTYGGWSGAGESLPDNTLFLSKAGDFSPHWQLEFARPQIVDDVIIHNRTDCCSDRLDDFYVCWSAASFPVIDDIAAFAFAAGPHCQHIMRAHAPAGPGSQPDVIHIGPQAGPVKSIRIQLPPGKEYLQLAEVQVTRCLDDYCPL